MAALEFPFPYLTIDLNQQTYNLYVPLKNHISQETQLLEGVGGYT